MNITERSVKALRPPKKGQTIEWDDEIKSFGVRLTAGAISYVIDYRIFGRQRRYTIGRHPEFTATMARDEAIELRKRIRNGEDPMEERQSSRNEPMFGDLIDSYLGDTEFAKKRPSTIREYKRMAESIIRPALGKLRLKAVTQSDISALHSSLKATPYQANRVLAVVSAMYSFALHRDRKWATENPTKGIMRNIEEEREQYLNKEDPTEIARFTKALDGYKDQNAANALRLLLLTGARSGEILKSEWSQFNLHRGTWTKPSSHTKQKRTDTIPLSAPALALLKNMKLHDGTGALFPGRGKKDSTPKQARKSLRRPWLQVCKDAGLIETYEIEGKRKGSDGKPKMLKKYRTLVRPHDLRHTFASHLASSGVSAPLIGKLMGHTQAATTKRYIKLQDDSLRDATNQLAEIIDIASRWSA